MTKEQIFDDQIAHFADGLAYACAQAGIPFFMTFDLGMQGEKYLTESYIHNPQAVAGSPVTNHQQLKQCKTYKVLKEGIVPSN
jgi:hypothetical protein